MTLVLGIETSCDETAAAVVADGREILSNVVASQIDLHRQYGGVFPEMASRQHVITIQPVIEQAMREAFHPDRGQVCWDDLDAIAVTHGPGLAGSLLVGVNVAKGLAYGRGLPLIGVNHIEAHIATNWLEAQEPHTVPDMGFPLLCLVVSGGHTELLLMSDYGQYRRLGSTIDDAAGEAFDKVARMLGLGYPGGPAIQRVAEGGNPAAFSFPRAVLDRSYDFSFSGLKTAVLRAVQQYEPGLHRPADRLPFNTPHGRRTGSGDPSDPAHSGDHLRPQGMSPQTVADMAASFQVAVVDVLVEKTSRAALEYEAKGVLMAGGVAANRPLRERMGAMLSNISGSRRSPRSPCTQGNGGAIPLRMPPIALATDNATGVCVAGHWALKQGRTSGWDLDVVPRLSLAVADTCTARRRKCSRMGGGQDKLA